MESKRMRGEEAFPLRQWPAINTYGNVPMFNSPTPTPHGQPAAPGPPGSNPATHPPARHMMSD